jgi:hypothetical protein
MQLTLTAKPRRFFGGHCNAPKLFGLSKGLATRFCGRLLWSFGGADLLDLTQKKEK